MAADGSPIAIEIQDKVPSGIKQKIVAIGAAARQSQSSVDRLQKALSQIDAQPFVQLARAQSMLTNESNKAALNYLKQERALNLAIAAEQAAQRATLAAEAALSKKNASVDRAVSQQNRLADAIKKAKAAEAANAAQASFNTQLGVNRPVANSAKASAAVFKENLDAADATRKLEEAQRKQAAAAAAMSAANAKATADLAKLGKQSGLTRMQLLTIQYTINDVAASLASGISPFTILFQQGGQVTQAFGGLKGTLGAIATALGPVGLAVAAVGASVAVFVGAVTAADNQLRNVNKTLALTNGATGLTAGGFLTMSEDIAKATNTSIASNRELMTILARTGTMQAQQIREFTVSAQQLSKLSGESADKIVEAFAKAGEAPGKYAVEFNKQFNFLSAAQIGHIRELDEMGRKSEATAALSKALYDYLGKQAPQNLTALGRAWEYLSVGISNVMTNSVRGIRSMMGTLTVAEQLADKQKELARFSKDSGGAFPAWDRRRKQLQDEVSALQAQVNQSEELAKKQAENVKITQAGVDASGRLADHWLDFGDNAAAATREVNKFRKDIEAALKANPNDSKALAALKRQADIEKEIRKKYTPDAAKAIQLEESRALTIAKINGELNKQINAAGLLAQEREKQQKLDQIDVDLASRKQKKLSPTEREDIGAKIAKAQQLAQAQQALDQVYENAIGPLRDYQLTLAAVSDLQLRGAISMEQADEAANRAVLTYEQFSNPLKEVNRDLDQQIQLLGLMGFAREKEQQLMQIENQLRQQGKSLSAEERAALGAKLDLMDKLAPIQQAYNSILANTYETERNFGAQQTALNMARQNGILTLQQYTVQMSNLMLQYKQFQLEAGNGNFADAMQVSLGRLLEGHTSVLASLSSIYGDFFVQIGDGFANSLGNAIVMGDSLSDSLGNVARQALGQLISGFVKLGIQMLLQQAMGRAAAAATAAQSTALAATVAASWAPAAAAVSLASFGTNTAPAMTGASAMFALTASLAALNGFKSGGYTGNNPVDKISGVVHGQEFVVNAEATKRNLPLLQSINSGSTPTASSVGAGGGGVNISIENYGTSKDFEVQQLDENTVRIIARDEVNKTGPSMVANQLADANSKVSRSLTQNTNVQRRRG